MQEVIIPPFQPTTSPQQESQVDLSEFSDFAQGVLNTIPEPDRPVLAKHLKTWDGNVTKKFQEIHEQYKPYKELGAPEDLQQAVQYAQMIQNDPVGFIQLLTDAVREAGMDIPGFEPTTPPEDNGGGSGFAPEIEQRFKQYDAMMQGMLNKFESFVGQYSEQQQMAQLDKVLKEMHTAHGDFNDDFFLLQLEKGKSPEEAIKEWNNLIGKYGNQPHRPAPVLPPTNGAVRHDQVDPSKLSRQDRLAYGLQILNANRD